MTPAEIHEKLETWQRQRAALQRALTKTLGDQSKKNEQATGIRCTKKWVQCPVCKTKWCPVHLYVVRQAEGYDPPRIFESAYCYQCCEEAHRVVHEEGQKKTDARREARRDRLV